MWHDGKGFVIGRKVARRQQVTSVCFKIKFSFSLHSHFLLLCKLQRIWYNQANMHVGCWFSITRLNNDEGIKTKRSTFNRFLNEFGGCWSGRNILPLDFTAKYRYSHQNENLWNATSFAYKLNFIRKKKCSNHNISSWLFVLPISTYAAVVDAIVQFCFMFVSDAKVDVSKLCWCSWCFFLVFVVYFDRMNIQSVISWAKLLSFEW